MKLSLFADDMIVYMENPIDSTQKLLDLINEFGKIAGYSQYPEIKGIPVHQQRNCRNRNQEKIPFDIATRKIKYLEINLNKEVKDPYSEN